VKTSNIEEASAASPIATTLGLSGVAQRADAEGRVPDEVRQREHLEQR